LISFLGNERTVFTSGYIYEVQQNVTTNDLAKTPLSTVVRMTLYGVIYGFAASLVGSITLYPAIIIIPPVLAGAMIIERFPTMITNTNTIKIE